MSVSTRHRLSRTLIGIVVGCAALPVAGVLPASGAVAFGTSSGATARASSVTATPAGRGHRHRHPYTSSRGMPRPLVVAHRGASGYRPEHTAGAYELAAAMGADYIEPDLVMTKDGQLVDRHEPEISGTTDVADHPEFASRRTTKVLDGTPTTGWFTEDFTLAELRTLRAKERLPKVRQHNTIYDGRWQIPTFEDTLKLREQLSRKYGRTIGIIPEIKHSTYFHDRGLNPEKAFLPLVRKYGLNSAHAPIWLQSFELTNLQTVRTMGYRGNSTFLSWTGSKEFDGPYDRIAAGDKRHYSDYMKPAELTKIARFANGIGPDKGFVIPTGTDGRLGTPSSLVADAHAAGLKVIPYTFRNENQFMAKDFWNGTNPNDYGKAVDEQVTFLRTGIDGLFTDNTDTGVLARETFRHGSSH